MPNRRAFEAQVAARLAEEPNDQPEAALAVFDVDHFKQVNDNLGHEAGDLVLCNIVEPISSAIRPRDLFGRMGGEEFLVFLSGADHELANTVAERIRAEIESLEVLYRNQKINVTASLGVAQWDGRSHLDELFHQADKALYQAKNRGRNQVASLTQSDSDSNDRPSHENHFELP